MKNKISTLLFLLLIVTIPLSPVFSQNPNVGTAGAKFLSIPATARYSALGNSGVALTDDASAMFVNPAGLANVKNFDGSFASYKWFDMYDYSALAAAYNLGDAGVMGVNLVSFSTGKIEITTERSPNGTGRYYDAADLVLGLGYSRYLTDKFSVGVTAKYVYQRIWNETADGIAFDAGTQYHIDFNNMVIAMSLSNFGPDLQFDGPDLNITVARDDEFTLSRLTPGRLTTDPYPLPLNFQVGIAMDVFKESFMSARAAIDVVHPNDNKEMILLGGEVSVFDRIVLRGGYGINQETVKGSLGAGAAFFLGETNLSFDYSYTLYDILPDVQRITLGVRF